MSRKTGYCKPGAPRQSPHCWGVDGGCVLVHYEYEHMPNAYCAKCGGPCYVEESYNPLLQKHRRFTVCRNCNSSCENVHYDGGGLPVGGY